MKIFSLRLFSLLLIKITLFSFISLQHLELSIIRKIKNSEFLSSHSPEIFDNNKYKKNFYSRSLQEKSSTEETIKVNKTGNLNTLNFTSHIWVVNTEIGYPKQNIVLEIDTTISATWVPSYICENCLSYRKYNSSASRTVKKSNEILKIIDYLGDVEGELIEDDFQVTNAYTDNNTFFNEDIKLKNFSFIEAKKLTSKFYDIPEGKLALSNINKYGDKFSFISMLYNTGKIGRKVFALEFDNSGKDKENAGKIYFGDIPDKIKQIIKLKDDSDKAYHDKNRPESISINNKFGICNSTTSKDLDEIFRDGWTCEISHLYFNTKNELKNLTYAKEIDNARVIFDSSYEFIGVTKNQYTLIYEDYLIKNFEGDCKENKATNNDIYYICNLNKDKLKSAKSLFIILQGFTLELNSESLFVNLDKNDLDKDIQDKNSNYLFAIRFFDINKEEDEQNEKEVNSYDDIKLWIFGHLFFKDFITVFDFESDQVGFYSENVYDITNEWEIWYRNDYYTILIQRYFWMSIAACSLVASFLILSCIFIIRKNKRDKAREDLIKFEMK